MKYAGMNIVISTALTDRPRFELSHRLQEILGPAYVREFNVWSAEFFGVEGRAYKSRGTLYMSPATYEQFRQMVATRPGWEL